MRIQAKLRRALAGAGALGVGLAVAGFTFPPVPVPTVSPTAPAPLPSIATTVGSLLSPGSGGATGTNNQQAQTGRPAGTSSTGTPNSGSAAGAPALQAAAAPAAEPATTGNDQASASTAVKAAHTVRPGSGLPPGGSPGGLGGAPLPFAPAILAVLIALLGFFGLRMTAPAPAASHRLRLRVGVSSAGTGAPAGAAAAAAICLLESTLPGGFTVRRDGDSAVLVEAPALHRALLFGRLPEIAARASRVGLGFEWTAQEAASKSAPRFRLALG